MRLGEFWLSQRPRSPFWHLTWFDPETRQTIRRSTGLRDLPEAEQLLAEHYLKSRRLDSEQPASVPIGLILDRFLEDHSSDPAKAAVKHWKAFWKTDTVDQLTALRQQEFIAHLQSRYAGDSVTRYISVGHRALRLAHRLSQLQSLPPLIPAAAPNNHRTQVLSVTEAKTLFRVAKKHTHWHRYVWLAFGTAARPGAILSLTRSQVDLKAKVLDLAPPGWKQTKKRRPVIPLVPRLAAEMKRWTGPEALYVHWRGKPIKRARETFVKVSKAAGFNVTAYVIRHTLATELRRRGVPEWETEAWLGHRLPGSATTARYTHLRPDFLKTVGKAVNDYLGEVSATQVPRKRR
jgi:integrase